ncbi:branched-chain amino acid aminotransferase [Radiomyces spectabilis]|uniref:branched-chain amino acid aminotransferase n=1 Tax=Radiomyces spectabilis TaxID=64574 RepID=UPI00221F6009|nr:branched-chain amino acid aminotransferase [Radiomyces spectabilis]KAI8393315.1 branched-chain amino acid aminotransferase [Radiomyces spectabilis]
MAHDIERSKLQVEQTEEHKPLIPLKELTFGKHFTDHMLTVEWDKQDGWHEPHIKPYQKLQLDPSSTVFHYGFECFEGMKAYKDDQGHVRLFRPEMNMERLNHSAARVGMPRFNGEELLKCIVELLRLDERWIPMERGYSLYLRPTMISTYPTLGIRAPEKVLLFVIACPVGPYYSTGFKAVSLLATSDYVRAWPHGTGDTKVGGNYAPGVLPQNIALEQGYQQNLWLFGKDEEVTEAGTMNFFMLWENPSGRLELLTPALNGLILPGITRDSVIQLVSSWEAEMKIRVIQDKITMAEILQAVHEDRVIEMFGTGTACIVSPIKCIGFKGRDISIPLDPQDFKSEAGHLTKKINQAIMDIQYGVVDHPWSRIVF